MGRGCWEGLLLGVGQYLPPQQRIWSPFCLPSAWCLVCVCVCFPVIAPLGKCDSPFSIENIKIVSFLGNHLGKNIITVVIQYHCQLRKMCFPPYSKTVLRDILTSFWYSGNVFTLNNLFVLFFMVLTHSRFGSRSINGPKVMVSLC